MHRQGSVGGSRNGGGGRWGKSLDADLPSHGYGVAGEGAPSNVATMCMSSFKLEGHASSCPKLTDLVGPFILL